MKFFGAGSFDTKYKSAYICRILNPIAPVYWLILVISLHSHLEETETHFKFLGKPKIYSAL